MYAGLIGRTVICDRSKIFRSVFFFAKIVKFVAVIVGINNRKDIKKERNKHATLKVMGLCPEVMKRKLTEARMRNPKVNNHHHYCLRLAVISARDKPVTESRNYWSKVNYCL